MKSWQTVINLKNPNLCMNLLFTVVHYIYDEVDMTAFRDYVSDRELLIGAVQRNASVIMRDHHITPSASYVATVRDICSWNCGAKRSLAVTDNGYTFTSPRQCNPIRCNEFYEEKSFVIFTFKF